MTVDWVPRYSKQALTALTIGGVLLTSSCGTILHPERRGQPAGRLDPKIVALDAVGMLFFFVPGVIAFAVDFSNGTIYLPPEHYGDNEPVSSGAYRSVKVDPTELDQARIEQVVRDNTPHELHLAPGTYHVQAINSADELRFDQFSGHHHSTPAQVIFRGQSH